MTLKIVEIVAILLSALMAGMFWGPWLALTRSIRTFEPEVFLAVVQRLNLNMAGLMTLLMPLAMASILPVLALAYGQSPRTFDLALAGLGCFALALVVTTLVEVPIVKQIVTWTPQTLPDNWRKLRDRWGAFHIVRVLAVMAGLGCLVAGAVYY